MSPFDVLAALRRRPFVPFRLQVSDDTAYTIKHPDLVVVTLDTLYLGKPADGKPGVAEHMEIVALSHVVKILPVEQAPSPAAGSG